jgi:phosphoglycerate kinase
VSSKITVIENILDKVDHMIIGGGMTFTFVKALGGKIGDSICEDDKQDCQNFKIGKRKGTNSYTGWLRQMRFQMMPKLKS